MEIFIVMAESGEYDQRCEWIAGAYSTRAEAEQMATSKRAKSAEDRAAYNGWCDKRSPHYWAMLRDNSKRTMFGVLTDDAEVQIAAVIGPRPNDGWEADEFHVIAVPLGAWGRYQSE